jgi:hypothetical protein
MAPASFIFSGCAEKLFGSIWNPSQMMPIKMTAMPNIEITTVKMPFII